MNAPAALPAKAMTQLETRSRVLIFPPPRPLPWRTSLVRLLMNELYEHPVKPCLTQIKVKSLERH
jgi:hypothetical protein